MMGKCGGAQKVERKGGGRVWGQEVTVVAAVAYFLQLDPQTHLTRNSSKDGSTTKVSYNLHDPAKKPSAQEPVGRHGTAKSKASSLDSSRFSFSFLCCNRLYAYPN